MTGFVLPALSIGLGSLYIKPKRGFFPTKSDVGPTQPLVAQVTFEEVHHDELEITEHPVERGAAIADHAYKRPAEVVIRCAWSNSPSTSNGLIGAAVGVASAVIPGAGLIASIIPTADAVGSLLSGNGAKQTNAIYQQLLELQAAAVLFDVYTGKRVYRDMLFRSLSVTTAKESENALILTATCRQILLAATKTTQVPINPNAQAQPKKTTPTMNRGSQPLGSGTYGINLSGS